MPLAQISLLSGRTKEQKAELIRAVTAAIEQSLGAPRESVRVVLYEVEAAEWGVAGETIEARRSGSGKG